jgi:hypothetical protein
MDRKLPFGSDRTSSPTNQLPAACFGGQSDEGIVARDELSASAGILVAPVPRRLTYGPLGCRDADRTCLKYDTDWAERPVFWDVEKSPCHGFCEI